MEGRTWGYLIPSCRWWCHRHNGPPQGAPPRPFPSDVVFGLRSLHCVLALTNDMTAVCASKIMRLSMAMSPTVTILTAPVLFNSCCTSASVAGWPGWEHANASLPKLFTLIATKPSIQSWASPRWAACFLKAASLSVKEVDAISETRREERLEDESEMTNWKHVNLGDHDHVRCIYWMPWIVVCLIHNFGPHVQHDLMSPAPHVLLTPQVQISWVTSCEKTIFQRLPTLTVDSTVHAARTWTQSFSNSLTDHAYAS